MAKMNVLIAGCSFSATSESGWLDHNKHLHYPNILKANTKWQIKNIARGGCSNREIYLRATESCLLQKPDLCIVQWTGLHRLWMYEDNTVDDPTMFLPNTVDGHISSIDSTKDFYKIWLTQYQNSYISLKHWLEDQILLQNFLKYNNIPYIFVRGFPNFISDLECLMDQLPINSIPTTTLPDAIKTMLHFNNKPDEYILERLLLLIRLYSEIDKSKCIGYNSNDSYYGVNYTNDYADDGVHPGKQTNQNIADQILNFVKRKFIHELI